MKNEVNRIELNGETIIRDFHKFEIVSNYSGNLTDKILELLVDKLQRLYVNCSYEVPLSSLAYLICEDYINKENQTDSELLEDARQMGL